jgi:hypothetical protein
LPARVRKPATAVACIIRRFRQTAIMEAERLNAIANQLADLSRRSTELRRYL